MKKNKFYFILTFILSLLVLTACQTKAAGEEELVVLDSDNQEIYQTTNSQTLDYFFDVLDVIDDEEDDEDSWVDLPKDAEVNYSYNYSNRKEGSSTQFKTYKNYPYITISNIPSVPEVTIKLSEEEAEKLNQPDAWLK
ncbi:MAG: hypothetical protein Q4A90_05475 [Streptococcus sp.]|nr:hypothetical protein [Streptococcus sp.]